MEEIDKIIISTLRHLDCDLNEDIECLKQFDADMVVNAISSCLHIICKDTELNLPKRLPPSMPLKLKIASNIAQQIKNLGFRGDMGYQTILYCNEFEVRRVLMFLIEKLPKETSKVSSIEHSGYVSALVKSIEDKIRNSLKQMWLPSQVVNQGIAQVDGSLSIYSFGHSAPLITEQLRIPEFDTEDKDLQHYYVHCVQDVTKQCSPRNLLPSLLFQDDFYYQNTDVAKISPQHIKNASLKQASTEQFDASLPVEEVSAYSNVTNSNLSNTESENMDIRLKAEKNRYQNLQSLVSEIKEDSLSMKNTLEKEKELLQYETARLELSSKVMSIMSNEENRSKLENYNRTLSDRIIKLSEKWKEIKTPLLNEYNSLTKQFVTNQKSINEQQAKLNKLLDIHKELEVQMREKDTLEQHLINECRKVSRNNSRTAYTHKIMEIVGNIKKQNNEIYKVLKDSKDIQKDINNLTGQVDRSFTLSDELIFYDAKQDETARKSYKLLASLRDEFNDTLKAVDELGLIEREARNLQEQAEAEKTKDMAVKLDKVYLDIQQVKKELQIMESRE